MDILALALATALSFAERRETRNLVPAILKTVRMSCVHADTMLIGAHTGYLDVMFRVAPLPLGNRMRPLSALSWGGLAFAFAFALVLTFRKSGRVNTKVSRPGVKVSHDATARAWIVNRIKAIDVRSEQGFETVQIISALIDHIRSESRVDCGDFQFFHIRDLFSDKGT